MSSTIYSPLLAAAEAEATEKMILVPSGEVTGLIAPAKERELRSATERKS